MGGEAELELGDVRRGIEEEQYGNMANSNEDFPDRGMGVHSLPKMAEEDSLSDGLLVGLIVGVSVIGVVCVIIIIVMQYKRNKKAKELDNDTTNMFNPISKSAPTTSRFQKILRVYSQPYDRDSSPVIQRKEFPGIHHKKNPLVRSVTMDTIPDFTMPERVQPGARGSMDITQFQHSLLGHLQPELYRLSVSDEDAGEEYTCPVGQLWFSVMYDATIGQLIVTLIKAKNLKGRGKASGPRDPFVKLFLLPDEKTSQQSRVIRKSLAPVFNETFYFKVPQEDLKARTLRMSCYDVDKRRLRHSLGHVFLHLSDVDVTCNDVLIRNLELAAQRTTGLGELNISISFVSNSDKIIVTVGQARGLNKLDFDNQEVIYIKVQLLYGQRTHRTKKTSYKAATCDPAFNESFHFGMAAKQLETCSVRVSLMVATQSLLGGKEREYGRVTVGSYMHARGQELQHWQEMVAQPRQPVARWHPLNAAPPGKTRS